MPMPSVAAARLVEIWNANHPAGTPVIVVRDDGTTHCGRITNPAQVTAEDRPVAWVSGLRGFYSLDRVVTDTEALRQTTAAVADVLRDAGLTGTAGAGEDAPAAPRWIAFNPAGWLPAERRPVLCQIPKRGSSGGIAATVAVGYLRYAAGDADSPQFIVPGVGGPVTHWADCLGDGFSAEPAWQGWTQHGAPARPAAGEDGGPSVVRTCAACTTGRHGDPAGVACDCPCHDHGGKVEAKAGNQGEAGLLAADVSPVAPFATTPDDTFFRPPHQTPRAPCNGVTTERIVEYARDNSPVTAERILRDLCGLGPGEASAAEERFVVAALSRADGDWIRARGPDGVIADSWGAASSAPPAPAPDPVVVARVAGLVPADLEVLADALDNEGCGMPVEVSRSYRTIAAKLRGREPVPMCSACAADARWLVRYAAGSPRHGCERHIVALIDAARPSVIEPVGRDAAAGATTP